MTDHLWLSYDSLKLLVKGLNLQQIQHNPHLGRSSNLYHQSVPALGMYLDFSLSYPNIPLSLPGLTYTYKPQFDVYLIVNPLF